jgi:hypothetical protein
MLESFKSLMALYTSEIKSEKIDYKLIERLKLDGTYDLSRHYIDEYSYLKGYMLDGKPETPEIKNAIENFYGTALVLGMQKINALIKFINESSQQ